MYVEPPNLFIFPAIVVYIKRPSFFDFNLFIARPTGIFRRLISDAKGPILNFALITLVVRYLRSHVIY